MNLSEVSDLVENLQHHLVIYDIYDLVDDLQKGATKAEELEKSDLEKLLWYMSTASIAANEEADKLDYLSAKLDRVYKNKLKIEPVALQTQRRKIMNCAVRLVLDYFQDLSDSVNKGDNSKLDQAFQELKELKPFICLCTARYKEYMDNLEEGIYGRLGGGNCERMHD